jgi:hypothetical protein
VASLRVFNVEIGQPDEAEAGCDDHAAFTLDCWGQHR